MSKTNVNDQITIDIFDLLENDVRMSVVLILTTYGSLNLRQLSKMLDMTEPSAHVHIKSLLSRGYIELDTQMADRRGKYYKLTEKMAEFIKTDQIDAEISSKKQIINNEYYITMGKAIKSMTILTQRFGLYLSNYLTEHASKLAERHNKKIEENRTQEIEDIAHGALTFVPIVDKEDLEQIHKNLKHFIETVEQIADKNRDLKDDEIYDQVLISSLAIPLYKIDPRKDFEEL